MAAVAGTNLTYGTVGVEEDWHRIIEDVDRQDTPLMSMVGRDTAADTLHRWQTDKLRAPGKNRQVEANAFSAQVPERTIEVGNYTQIVSDSVLTSRTQDKTAKIGRGTETQYHIVRKGITLRRDIEFSLFQNEGGSAGDAAGARVLAGLPAWLQTNVKRAADGASSGHVSGVPASGATDGTPEAFYFSDIQELMQSGYSAGARMRILMVGTGTRVRVSNATFGGTAALATHTVQLNAARPTFLEGSIDVMVTNFGNLRVVPNDVQSTANKTPAGDDGVGNYRDRDALLIDPSKLAIAYLSPFMVDDQPVAGDISAARLLVAEYTLRVNNERGLAVRADIDPTNNDPQVP